MSHTYPLARTAQEAFSSEVVARTRRGAELRAQGVTVLSLETEWLTLDADEAEALLDQSESSIGTGFVQRYANASDSTVLAVTYWKLARGKVRAKADTDTSARPAPAAADDTDDLYFRSGRTKPRRRRRKTDPRQLDLFMAPDQKGYERRDPANPGIVLTEEEGDGTAFGGTPRTRKAQSRKRGRKT